MYTTDILLLTKEYFLRKGHHTGIRRQSNPGFLKDPTESDTLLPDRIRTIAHQGGFDGCGVIPDRKEREN